MYSSCERTEFWGCIMSVYRRKLLSTQDGSCNARECSAVIACKGLGVVVDTAKITRRNLYIVKWNKVKKGRTSDRMVPGFRF